MGSGKTRAGAQEVILILLENPGILFLVARQTYPELRDTTARTFFDCLPHELIKSYSKSENHLVLKNNSEVLFRSLDDPMKLKSLELGGFWIDEASETDEDIFLTLQGRLRQKLSGVNKLCGVLTTNPPNSGHWIEKYFVHVGPPMYELFKMTTYENQANLPEGYISDLEKNYPPQWIKKYLLGEFGFTSAGLPIFPMFMESMHVRDLSSYWRERDSSGKFPKLHIFRGYDFGFNHPAFLCTSVDSKGRWLWLVEKLGISITVNKLAEDSKFISASEFPNSRFMDFCDCAGTQRGDKTGEQTSIDILRAHKIFPIYRKSNPIRRSEIIARLLTKTVDGLPALMIDRGCKVCIDAMSGGYHYKKPANHEKFQQDEIEKDGFYEHMMDAAGYIADNLFEAAITQEKPKAGKLGNWQDFTPQAKYSLLGASR
uniref:Putative terminase n=1 Tax=viral metagenome TaxID=1070528 RepID=A0A6M3XTH0_9ZZZZ